MIKQKTVILPLIVLLLLPAVTLAQAEPGEIPGNVPNFLDNFIARILSLLWIIASAFVIVMFVLAGFKFLSARGEPTKINEAKAAVIWGIAGTAVIVLAWSTVRIVRLELGV